MWIHRVLCPRTPAPFLCASASRLVLCSLFLRVAVHVNISTEGATHDYLVPAPPPHRTYSHYLSSYFPRSVLGGPPTSPVTPLVGSLSVRTVPRADVPHTKKHSYLEGSQRVAEPLELGKGASERGSISATTSTQPFRYKSLSPPEVQLAKHRHFHGMPDPLPFSRYTPDVKEVYPTYQAFPQRTHVQFLTTRQPRHGDKGERTEGFPVQTDMETDFVQRQRRFPAQQQSYQLKVQLPLHQYALPQQRQSLPQQHNELPQQQSEWQQERPHAGASLLGQSQVNSFQLYSSEGRQADTYRLRTHSLRNAEAEKSQTGTTLASWPSSEQAIGSITEGRLDRPRSQVPWLHPQESQFPYSSYRSEFDGPEKAAQITEPTNPSTCNLEAVVPHICFSALDCPTPPANSQFTYICATAVSNVQSIPGLCRLPCTSPRRDEDPCPLGQMCVFVGGTSGICLDYCPPDGLPPCDRITCGPLQVCVRNYCRTEGALIDPSLCTPVLSSIDMDFFCDGSRSSPIEQ